MQQESWTHFTIIILLTAVAANLFILDMKVFSPNSVIRLSDISTSITPQPTDNSKLQPLTLNDSVCPNSCLALIQKATQSASRSGSDLNYIEELTPSVTQNQIQSVKSPVSREYYIPLGSGSTDKSSFTDLTATETVIDPSNYGAVKEAYFIASMSNPTRNGQVETQLYNVTDKHPVWGSHIIMNGPASQTITSDKITLDAGNKLYRVQLKSSLNYTISLDNAKIRIVTE